MSKRVLIAVPVNTGRSQVPVPFVEALVNLVQVTRTRRPEVEIVVRFFESLRVDLGRHQAVREALATDCTGIMWLDDDMVVPADTLSELLSHGKEVVSALYAAKTTVPSYFLWDRERNDWAKVYCREPRLQQSDMIAAGALYTETTVFTKLPYPWFLISMDPYGNMNYTEDVFFSQLCRNHGIQPYVDVSILCGHLQMVRYPQVMQAPNVENAAADGRKLEAVDRSRICQSHPEETKVVSLSGFPLSDGLCSCTHTRLERVGAGSEDMICRDCSLVLKQTARKP